MSDDSVSKRREHLKWRKGGGSMPGGVSRDLARWKGKTHKGRALSRHGGTKQSYMANLTEAVARDIITEDEWRALVAEAIAPDFYVPPREEWPWQES